MAETNGFNLAEMLKNVSNLDTGANPAAPQQIELIPLDLIDQDPNNFYSLDGIDQLAASIELLGLQQPILVRPSGGGRYTVISGHRRRAAAMLIRDGGSDQFKDGVPCIVDRSEASAALRELQLIYANADTRKLSNAELNKQAERVEMLLYELKEQGVEFPGRMRDHVAEACKLSKTKLARLKVIRDKLDPCFRDDYEKGDLTESAAYALAQQTPDTQQIVRKFCAHNKQNIKCLSEWRVKDTAELWKKISTHTCKKDKQPCSHAEPLTEKCFGDYYYPCKTYKCCDTCPNLDTCKSACPKLAEKVQKLKADAKAAKQQEKLAQVEKERPDVEQITALWQRFGQARKAAKVSVKDFKAAEKVYYGASDEIRFADHERGAAKITTSTPLPYGYSVSLSTVKYLLAAADCLGCSVDYLLCRTDLPEVSTGGSDPTPLQWQTGTPPQSGMYVVQFQDSGVPFTDLVYFHSAAGKFTYSKSERDNAVDAEALAWVQIPEADNG